MTESGNCRQTWEKKTEEGDRAISSIVSLTFYFLSLSFFFIFGKKTIHLFLVCLSHTQPTYTFWINLSLSHKHTYPGTPTHSYTCWPKHSVHQINCFPCQRRDITSRDCLHFSNSSFDQPAKEKSHRLPFAASCLPARGSSSLTLSSPFGWEENENIAGRVDIVVFCIFGRIIGRQSRGNHCRHPVCLPAPLVWFFTSSWSWIYQESRRYDKTIALSGRHPPWSFFGVPLALGKLFCSLFVWRGWRWNI